MFFSKWANHGKYSQVHEVLECDCPNLESYNLITIYIDMILLICISFAFHMDFICISYGFHMYFICISYVFLGVFQRYAKDGWFQKRHDMGTTSMRTDQLQGSRLRAVLGGAVEVLYMGITW